MVMPVSTYFELRIKHKATIRKRENKIERVNERDTSKWNLCLLALAALDWLSFRKFIKAASDWSDEIFENLSVRI